MEKGSKAALLIVARTSGMNRHRLAVPGTGLARPEERRGKDRRDGSDHGARDEGDLVAAIGGRNRIHARRGKALAAGGRVLVADLAVNGSDSGPTRSSSPPGGLAHGARLEQQKLTIDLLDTVTDRRRSSDRFVPSSQSARDEASLPI